MAFVKLDCGILDSTLWVDREARELFITALLMAVPREIGEETPTLNVRDTERGPVTVPPGWYGFIPAAGPGIVRRAGLERESGMAALERLCEVDDESRTPDFDGRRMVRVDGGYILLNYNKYRQKDHTAAERSARYREKQKAVTQQSASVTSRVTNRSVTQAEAEAEVKAEISTPKLLPENENQMEKPASINSETYDQSTSTDHPDEGRRAGNPEFSSKDSEAPMAEAAWLNLARKMSIEPAFAVALYAEMSEKGWIDNNGEPIAFLAQFLRASWQREQAKAAQTATKPADGKREPWMIEADIERTKEQAAKIQRDKSSFNPPGISFAEHTLKFEDAWYADLAKLRDEVQRQLPAEWAKFEREHAAHVAEMLADKVDPAAMGDEYLLARLAEFLPDEVPTFERWDREFNKADAWKDPSKLTPEARTMVRQLKVHIQRLEGELRAAMVAV